MPDQTQSDHNYPVTQADVRNADRIESDASQGREGGVLEPDSFGNLRHQVAARNDGLGVTGSFAAVCYSLADFQVGHGGVAFQNNSRAGIPQRCVFAELGQDLPGSRDGARDLHDIQHLPDVGRVVGHFLDKAVRVNAGRLGSAADQREDRTDQNVMGRSSRIGHFVHDDFF